MEIKENFEISDSNISFDQLMSRAPKEIIDTIHEKAVIILPSHGTEDSFYAGSLDTLDYLKEQGIDDIIIGEGMVIEPKDYETPAAAFESLGYNSLIKRYGIQCINIHDRPFQTVDLGSGNEIKFNKDMLESDFLVDIPVLKTHAQSFRPIKQDKFIHDFPAESYCRHERYF